MKNKPHQIFSVQNKHANIGVATKMPDSAQLQFASASKSIPIYFFLFLNTFESYHFIKRFIYDQTMRMKIFNVEARRVSMEKNIVVRTINLEGSFNFRDLGGYETLSGKKVKTGVLYRSGNLQNITDKDIEKIKQTGLKTIFDLRGSDEVKNYPTPSLSGIITKHVPLIEIDRDMVRQPKDLAKYAESLQDPGTILEKLYREVTKNTKVYKDFFATLLTDPKSPVLFHCMAGKDRTGVMAALTLHTLDVPDEFIFADYLYTNNFLDALRANLQPEAAQVDQALMQAMLEARREYLQAFFDEVQTQFGSVDQYIHEAIGLSKSDVETLRASLLVE